MPAKKFSTIVGLIIIFIIFLVLSITSGTTAGVAQKCYKDNPLWAGKNKNDMLGMAIVPTIFGVIGCIGLMYLGFTMKEQDMYGQV